MGTSRISDAEFMADPTLWPRWPFLPMKRGNEDGVMFAVNGQQMKVFMTDIWTLSLLAKANPDVPISAILSGTAVEEFNDFEAILAAGWRID